MLPIYLLTASIVFLTVGIFYLGGKMSTGTQALADLQTFVSNLTTAVQNAAKEFAALLEAIKNNNGVNPGAIETLITQGQNMVKTLNDSVAAAQAAVNPPEPVTVSISPTSASLAPGATQQFSASVSNASDTTVTWKAGTGTVDANGMYTAPATTGTDTVTATSNADPTKSASASITIA